MNAEYIIVGAGSAGCVLANRLSADPANRVLLLEAGPPDGALSLKMPAAMLSNLRSTRFNWAYQGAPEPGLGGRVIQHDRGKALGGSSSINGMVFIRGHAMDFEGWRQTGCDGWGYADVLPYFKRLENYTGGADLYRGQGGPMEVHRPRAEHPLNQALIAAGHQAGYPVTEDINGVVQEGFGRLDSSVYRGERWSAARAYLDPARDRANLEIKTEVTVEKILFEGTRAIGLKYRRGDQVMTAHARKEVILSAGAVASPQLLMLSGIGPVDHVSDHGIAPVLDLPGVGQNLNDHPDYVMKFKCLKPVSLAPKTRGWRRILAGLEWLMLREGICGSNHFDVVACMRSDAGVPYPDIQLTLSPVAVGGNWVPMKGHAFQIHIGLMRAYSRGAVTLRSSDPSDPPDILVNYLDDPRDRALLKKSVDLVRELVAQPAFKDLAGDEIFPGIGADLDASFRTDLASQWHLSGTARMGAATDQGAVVDPEGRVHGAAALRVVDASIMPQVTNGNTNAPVLMLAEKLADAILGLPPLERIEAEVWQNPDWEQVQR